MLLRRGSLSALIFYHRADHGDLPLRMHVGHGRDQVQIHALIDHAAIAEPGMRQGGLRRMILAYRQRKMRGIDAGGKAMHIGMAIALGAVQAGTASHQQIGLLVERVFTLDQERLTNLVVIFCNSVGILLGGSTKSTQPVA